MEVRSDPAAVNVAPLSSVLPFKKPGNFSCIPANAVPVVVHSWKFFFKAITLNFIVTRYINLAPELSQAALLVYFPVISYASVVAVSAEFAAREWVYYRLLEHGVLVQFEPRDSVSALLKSTGALWTIGGTVFVLVLMIYVSRAGLHLSADLDDYEDELPWSAMFNVLTQAALMIFELHSIRQIASRLVTINTLLHATDKARALEWLGSLELMDEATVQLHFLYIAEAARQTGLRRTRNRASRFLGGESPETAPDETAPETAPDDATSAGDARGSGELLLPALDFAKVGRAGYTPHALEQLRGRGSCYSGALGGCGRGWLRRLLGGSSWALAVASSTYTTRADQQSMSRYRCIHVVCTLVGQSLMAAGVSSTADIFNLLFHGRIGGDVGNSTIVDDT